MDKKILIVDDSEDFRNALCDIFKLKGYAITAAENGIEALNVALTDHPDLILLDVRMPEMDGFEVLRKLRQDDWGKEAKVLLLTLVGTSEIVPDDIEFDSDDFLMKTQWGLENIAARVEKELRE